MFKIRVTLLGVLVLLIAGGVSASTASALGPYWHVNGAKLGQGAKQLKLQLKGTYIQKFVVASIAVTTECRNSKSEFAGIEGKGLGQGQVKGRLTFSQCNINIPKCTLSSPITTNQAKGHLVTFKGTQTKYALLFEPTQGVNFSKYVITNGSESCPVAGEFTVQGRVAAELIPTEVERQELLMVFPETPISTVFHESVETKIGLTLFGNEFRADGFYGARLDSGEKFGVFGQ